MANRLLDSPWFYYAIAGLLLVLAVVSQFEIQFPTRPKGGVEDLASLQRRAGPDGDLNVLFILIDTLRSDRLGSYGYERDTTPTLDLLAQHGIRFDKVIAQSSWTKTSMASLWTSTYPISNGVMRWNHAVPDQAQMPAELFRQRGFRTAGIYRNGWCGPQFGFEQGFDNYIQPTPSHKPEKFQQHNPSTSALQGTDEDVTDAAGEFFRSFSHERFFLYLHYMDAHQYAYDEASALFGTSYSDNYDNAVRWTDRNIAAVLQDLEDLDLFKKTLVVIASDHGEGFREHGFEGHAKTLYREVTHVPWIIVPPFLMDAGLVVKSPVENVDIWPTVFDLLGFDPAPGAQGRSAVPLIEAAARNETLPGADQRLAFAQLDRTWGKAEHVQPDPILAVTRGDQRLVRSVGDVRAARLASQELDERFQSHWFTEVLEVFDHDEDPWEARNLAESRPDLLEQLRKESDAYLSRTESPFGAPSKVGLEEMDLNQLRALGYVIR